MTWITDPETSIKHTSLPGAISARIYAAGLRTVGDVRKADDIRLLKLRGIGRMTLDRIRHVTAENPKPAQSQDPQERDWFFRVKVWGVENEGSKTVGTLGTWPVVITDSCPAKAMDRAIAEARLMHYDAKKITLVDVLSMVRV